MINVLIAEDNVTLRNQTSNSVKNDIQRAIKKIRKEIFNLKEGYR